MVQQEVGEADEVVRDHTAEGVQGGLHSSAAVRTGTWGGMSRAPSRVNTGGLAYIEEETL